MKVVIRLVSTVVSGILAAIFFVENGHIVIGTVVVLGLIVYAVLETALATKDQPFHLTP